MAQAKENNPASRAKAPAAPKAAAANGTVPAGEKRTRPTTRRPYYNRRPRRAQQPKEAATPIHIYPLGGLGEVGKNMTVYECNGDMIIVDCGLVFPDSEMFGVDMVIPDFTFVVQNKDKIKGLLITHGHEDHIGSIPYLLQKISLPVYGTRLTCGLIKNKLEEFGLAGKTKFVEIVPRQKIKLGCFTVEPIHVNHSIPDAVAFAIDSPAGTIIQTGDFKIDYTPLACGVTDLSTLSEYGQRGVLALLSDSTNAERPGFTATEQKVAAGVRSLFARARNKRIIIATFASNIYRVQQIIDLAVEDGRKVAFSGRPDQRRRAEPVPAGAGGAGDYRQSGRALERAEPYGLLQPPSGAGRPRRLHHHLRKPHPWQRKERDQDRQRSVAAGRRGHLREHVRCARFRPRLSGGAEADAHPDQAQVFPARSR